MYSKSQNTSILTKLIAGILAIVLLLPMLIFTALPNTVFGYNSATDQGVADFTASAQRLASAYQNIERKKQSALERLISSILPNFWTDGEADYDEYKVTDGSGGINQNWLIAIGSVRYKQDLNVMDEDTLEDLLYGKGLGRAALLRHGRGPEYHDHRYRRHRVLRYRLREHYLYQCGDARGLLQPDGCPLGQ